MKVPSNSCFPCRLAFCSFCFGSFGESSGSLRQHTKAKARHSKTTARPAINVKKLLSRKHHHFRSVKHFSSSPISAGRLDAVVMYAIVKSKREGQYYRSNQINRVLCYDISYNSSKVKGILFVKFQDRILFLKIKKIYLFALFWMLLLHCLEYNPNFEHLRGRYEYVYQAIFWEVLYVWKLRITIA